MNMKQEQMDKEQGQTGRKQEKTLGIFKEYLTEKNMSVHTIRSYLCAVRQFYRFFPEVTSSNLQQYKLYLIENYKPRTVNLRLSGLNRFLDAVGWEGERLKRIKLASQMHMERVISEGDYEYLKVCLLADRQYFYYFLIRFMAATGVRSSEVVQITAEDVKAGYKNLYSKGNKIHRIYIPRLLQKETLKWLKKTGRLSGDIFVNRFGNRISTAGIRKQLKKLAIHYRLSVEVMHPHSFRHRFAKNFIESCDDIALLSDLLGHESLETTRIYLRRSSSEQKAIINHVVDW